MCAPRMQTHPCSWRPGRQAHENRSWKGRHPRPSPQPVQVTGTQLSPQETRGHPRECSLCVKAECPQDPGGSASCSVCRMGCFHASRITCKISLVSWWQGTWAAPSLGPGSHPAFLLYGSYSLAPINCSPSSTPASVRTRPVNLGIAAKHEPPAQLAHWGGSIT